MTGKTAGVPALLTIGVVNAPKPASVEMLLIKMLQEIDLGEVLARPEVQYASPVVMNVAHVALQETTTLGR